MQQRPKVYQGKWRISILPSTANYVLTISFPSSRNIKKRLVWENLRLLVISEADHYSITVRFKALEVFSAENSLSLILASEVDVFSVQTTTAKARKLAAPVDPVKFKKHLRIVKAGSQPKIPLARDVCFPFDPS
ncbi:hypothetical protein TWF970_009748 [Orbilia oligospora]|uniref:Uncharacterized protein n=1 Tax=Orbilia oligospora TaxID=2813651 RepID=A0A7C8VKJ9_ORBOL|nr:hypothetical protein TWF970_009748 [Orbilia oligospora]